MANVIKRISYDPVGGANTALGVTYDNTTSGLLADNVQDAIDELALENDTQETEISNAQTDIDDLITLSGVAANSTDLGTFTGVTIPDGSDVKEALQSLETKVESIPQPFFNAGNYNATTNTPDLDLVGARINGATYRVNIAGTHNFGAFGGSISFVVGDKAVYNGITSLWEKWDVNDEVSSVFGRAGDVTAQSGDYTASQVTNVPAGNIASTDVQAAINELDSEKFASADFNSSFDTRLATKSTTDLAEGTNLYFTDERAQDAVGTILTDSSNIDFTYNDVANTITADLTTTGVAANTYGSASLVPVFVVDDKGRISSVTDTAISITSASVSDFNEASQDSVGGILTDSASVDFTYNDAGPSISAVVLPAGVDHDQLLNFVANEHVDHSAVQIATAASTSGLSGGGDITATRNLVVDITGTTALGATPDGADEFLLWDSSASARKKVTYTQLLAGVDVGSAGDINETSFSLATDQATPADVTGFLFSNAVVRSFQAIVSVYIDATPQLFEEYEIEGIQKGSDWDITIESTGDDSGVEFSITSLGQIQYTSLDYPLFNSGTIKFRVITTSV